MAFHPFPTLCKSLQDYYFPTTLMTGFCISKHSKNSIPRCQHERKLRKGLVTDVPVRSRSGPTSVQRVRSWSRLRRQRSGRIEETRHHDRCSCPAVMLSPSSTLLLLCAHD